MDFFYCVKCTLPSSKPDLTFNEKGVCRACVNFENRKDIDWSNRRNEFLAIIDRYRGKSNWDCIIPVSGGKDSTYQVLKILEHDINPLCVTATTCHLSEIGRKNIENIKKLGVDYIEFTPNPIVRRKLNRIGLTEVGDISWPEHVSIFTQPVQVAVKYKIPLLIWGENSQDEYGGPVGTERNNILNRAWLEEFGGLLGLRVSDLPLYGISKKNLYPYVFPPQEEVQQIGVTGLFLGYYFPWDGFRNAEVSIKNGFTVYDKTVENSLVNYENLDNFQTGIHDYFKFLKFGFGRASDIGSLLIRRGLRKRSEVMEQLKICEGKFPSVYLGLPLEKILEPLEMSMAEFTEVCDRFTNKALFRADSAGNLIKDKNGNLEKILYDNIVTKECVGG